MKALVLVLRGLPAGAIGPYGNRWIETPTLDALAARGVVYDWHFAAHPNETHGPWEWGRYSFFPREESPQSQPRPELLTLLHGAGVAARVIADPNATSALGAGQQALEDFGDEEKWLLVIELGALLPPWAISEEILEAYFALPPPADEEDDGEEDDGEEDDEPGENLLDEEPPIEPLLAPVSGPIDPTDDTLFRRLQTTFAAAVTRLDLMLDDLLAAVGDDVLVIVTSESGQALGERGIIGSWPETLHEEIVHVPLILIGPGCPPGRRVEHLTASVDLGVTLAAHFGVALEGAHGHDIHPAVLPDGAGLREYVALGVDLGIDDTLPPEEWAAAVLESLARQGRRAWWGLRTADWSLHVPVNQEGIAPRLYVKPDDRCEVNDVAQHHPELVESLERTLRAFVEATRADGPLVPPPLELGPPPS